jgi:nicotinamidase/pyrazinamidase
MPDELRTHDALIIADVQNDFCRGGALEVPGSNEVIPILNTWIRRAIPRRIPTFFTRDWHPLNHISFRDRGGPWPPHCIQNTRGAEFHPDLYVPSSGILLNKAKAPDRESYSAFGDTLLGHYLDTLDVARIWLGGLALDYCIVSTALDARAHGREVLVLLDATRAVNVQPGDGDRAVEKMEAAGAQIVRGSS